ncbi:hypothetical protein L1274_003004 [Duganella sp. HSC-15S17]|uniref:Uncharacterized protein n=1 Tax=Duganella violaceipulchra TaxID=2849652 RepID=A0ABT1GJZ7_9BURK|nr:hypothetical protein [Duganella violaceicalia]
MRCTSLYQALAHLVALIDSSTVAAAMQRCTARIWRCRA